MKHPAFYARVASTLSGIFYHLFGSVSWTSPPWLKKLRGSLRSIFHPNPGRAALILVLIAFTGGFYLVQQRETDDAVTAQFKSPTTLRDDLTIDFVLMEGTPASAAPLEQYGKPLHTGIKMIPSLSGQWQWRSDSKLAFTPKEDWPAGQTYRVIFNRSVFDKKIKMKGFHYEFSTAPLQIEVEDLRLYQDLKDPQVQKIVGTLNFNFPVDPDSLTPNTRLIVQEVKNSRLNPTAESIPFTLTFDEFNKKAFVETSPVKLSETPRYVNLIIETGVKAAKGPSKNKTSTRQKLFIPDSHSLLQIKEAVAAIQRDQEDNPEQVLTLETTLGMNSADLSKYLTAYVLPKDYPATPFSPVRKDYHWSQPGEVAPEVLKMARPVELRPLPEEHPSPTSHHFEFEAHSPSYLYIQVAKGLTGAGGFSLTKEFKAVLQTPDHPQEIHFLHKGSLMAKSGGKKITLAVRGIPEVKLTICHVLAPHVNHLMTQTSGDFQNPQFRHASFGHEAISQIFSDFRQFNLANPCELNYASIDLEQYLAKSKNPLGLFLLKAQGWNAENETSTGIEAERLLLITDMDLIVKDNADDTHDLYVHSITEGLPVAGADVSVLGKNSLPIITASTDAEGHVNFPDLKDFKDDRKPTLYLVRKGEDVSFIPYQRRDRELNYSRFDTHGVTHGSEHDLSACLFSDRGLYRPGDQIHIGAVVKNRFAEMPSPGLPLQIVLTDPRGATLLDQKIALPATPILSLDYPLPPHAPTGSYHVKLYVVKDNQSNHLLGSNTMKVEEFLPDRLKIEARLVKEGADRWLSPHDQKATVSLWNLFGAPAAGHKIKAKMVLTPRRALHFPRYANYRFVDPLPEPDSKFMFQENFTDAAADDKGNAEFHLNLERFSKATYQLDFFAEGFEGGGGRSVRTEQSALVTPHKFLVGYQSQGDLHFLKKDSQQKVQFIAINPEQQSVPLKNLQAELMSVQSVYALVKKPDGTYRYQSQRQKTVNNRAAFEISPEGSEFILPTHQAGDFALALKDGGGNLLCELLFSVVGESGLPCNKNEELKVKLDKQVYHPGDTIEMQITSPFTGAGLLTIERDKVYAHQWFKTDSTTSVQKIAIPPEFQGNGYVNVSFIRSWDSDEIYMNPLSYAVVPFQLSSENRRLHVTLDVPEFVRAGEELSIRYSTDEPAQILLFAVDEGILRLDGYQTPDPLAHFFRKSALRVKTSQIADLILPKESGKRESSAAGGDGRLQLLAKNCNPFMRKAEKAVVFWSGIVSSGPLPQTIAYQVPDYFNGSLRVMAVAVSQDKVGNSVKQAQVQSYFTIHPNVPAFVSPKDIVTVTAAITNGLKNGDETTPAHVTLAASPHLTLIGKSEESLLIPPGQERHVAFLVQANEDLGGAELIFTATQGDKSSKVASTLSVRPACAYQTQLISGTEEGRSHTIHPNRKLYPEHRALEAAASVNPFILAHGLKGYLENYPYDCTEQLLSKSYAQLVMAKEPLFQLDPQKVQVKFRETLQFLRERQLSSGGFSYWPGRSTSSASKPASLLAMDYLTEAKLDGYAVPEDLFHAGIHFLETVAKEDPGTLAEAREQAYAIYLLTRNGMITSNYLTNLQLYLTANQKDGWQKDLTSVYMAASHQLMQNKQAADLLIGGYRMQQTAQDKSPFDDSLVADAHYITLVGRHFPEQKKKIKGDALMTIVKGISGNQFNTRSAACSIQALSSFSQNRSEDTLAISEAGADKKEKTLVSSSPFYQRVDFNGEASALRFHNPAEETYFYQVSLTGFDKEKPGKEIKNGLELFREYRNCEGKAVQSTRLGEQIEGHITARTLNHSTIPHVAIVDLLPGGFEVDPQSIKASGCDYVDVREDRIIFHCTLMSSSTELSYRLQAVNKGEYTVPPIFAQAMYQPAIQAQGLADKIAIR